MGALKFALYFYVIFLFTSCNIFERGYFDSNNQYRPKVPKFSLKDKPGYQTPTQLDTSNVYRLQK